MTIAFWCVFIAAILPYALAGYAKFSGPGYDNNSPRAFLDTLEGRRRRAHWAQLNSYESLPFFTAGVIIAHYLKAPQQSIDILAVLFVLARIVYGISYIADRAVIRSLAWFAAFICIASLFFISI